MPAVHCFSGLGAYATLADAKTDIASVLVIVAVCGVISGAGSDVQFWSYLCPHIVAGSFLAGVGIDIYIGVDYCVALAAYIGTGSQRGILKGCFDIAADRGIVIEIGMATGLDPHYFG